MYVPAPKVNQVYLSAIAELEREGIVPTPAEYAWLYELSLRAVRESREVPRWLAPDVFLGDVVLHALTVGASEWWDRFGAAVYGDGREVDRIVAWAWLLHHGADEAYLNRHTNAFRIRAAVLKFALSLPFDVTLGDIGWAVSAALGGETVEIGSKRVKRAGGSPSWGETIAWLSHEYKLNPADIAWRMPFEEVCALADATATTGGESASKDARALAEWRAVLDEIKKAHKSGNAEEGGGK